MTRPRRREAGFTLLEVLVALVVLGFLMVGLTQGTRFGLRAWTMQTRGIDARADLDAVDRTLRHLVAAIDPGDRVRPLPVVGAATRITFTSELPMAAYALPSRRADVAIGVDGRHRLVLRWTPDPPAMRLAPAAASEAELLQGVDHLEIGYWHPAAGEAPAGWANAWDRPVPPALIRFRLVFPKGDARRWPDIVAAPMRDRP